MRAQENYYQLPSAKSVLANRIEALARVIPHGSRLIDLGCNDGTIGNALLERGVASHIHGYDLSDIRVEHRPDFDFHSGNLLNFDLQKLPEADGVLILNVLHHVIGASEDRAIEILNYLLDRYEFVCVDLGSCTEVGDWGWRKAYDKLYASDKQLWEKLFAAADWRFKLLRYPAQGGHRVLWKLRRRGYPLNNLEVRSRWVRNIGSWAKDKQLLQVGEHRQEQNIATHVEYSLAESPQKDLFFIKNYKAPHAKTIALREMQLASLAEGARAKLFQRRLREADMLRVVKPIGIYQNSGLVSIYEPDLFEAKPSHYQDWSLLLSDKEARAAFVLSCTFVQFGQLPPTQLLFLCDFQMASCWDGLSAVDFEPNQWLHGALEK